jgi:AcrR family transcriptional regulator
MAPSVKRVGPTANDPGLGVRERRRLEVMRRVQARALDLFERRGFEEVTIEEIAAGSDVSPPTVYRHFGTKEGLVLWDEYDPMLFAAVADRLSSATVIESVRGGLVQALDRIYAKDSARILRRARLLAQYPALAAANVGQLLALRRGMASLFLEAAACRDALDADVTAAAIVATLEVAVDHWVAAGGKTPLRQFFDAALRRLSTFAASPGKRAARTRNK